MKSIDEYFMKSIVIDFSKLNKEYLKLEIDFKEIERKKKHLEWNLRHGVLGAVDF